MKRTILAAIAATSLFAAVLALMAPVASNASTPNVTTRNMATPAAPCAPGDIVHAIAPSTWSIQPHRGFDPLTATDAELACYGVGPRPKGADDLAVWTGNARKYHYVVPVLSGNTFPSHGLSGSESTTNWTGYENRTSDNAWNYYYVSQSMWSVPSVASNVTYYAEAAAWVGLGGDVISYPQSSVIWQAGTGSVTGPTASAYFWYENYGCTPGTSTCPNSGNTVGLSYPAPAIGDSVTVGVNASNGFVYYRDNTNGQSTNLYVSINNTNTGYTSEYVMEEPSDQCGSGSLPCIPFGNPAFVTANYNGTANNLYFNQANYFRIDLADHKDNNKIVAQPPAPSGNGNYGVTCCAF